MWSEHCAYKNTRKLLRLFPTEKKDKDSIGQVLVKAGEENAGVIDVRMAGVAFDQSTIIRVPLNHLKVLPLEWEESYGIFLRWVPARFFLPTLRFGDLNDPHVKRLFAV